MGNNKKKPFHVRSFVSITLFFTFILLAGSGVAMYLRPEGSIARWCAWTLLGLSKQEWESVHAVFSMTFVLLAVLHLLLNFKVLVKYVYQGMDQALKRKKELVASLGLVCMIVILIGFHIRPIREVMDLRERIKNGGHLIKVAPPESDFEKKPLVQVAEILEMDVEEVMEKLRTQGINVNSQEETLQDISEKDDNSPQDIYELIVRNILEH